MPEGCATLEYVRQARRLRGRLRCDPVRLYRQLQELSEIQDATPHTPARVFAQRVAARLDGPILRYSNRVELLREAGGMGIDRFEASLIIAAVMHEAAKRRSVRPRAVRGRGRFPAGLVTALLVESAVLLAGWWLLQV